MQGGRDLGVGGEIEPAASVGDGGLPGSHVHAVNEQGWRGVRAFDVLDDSGDAGSAQAVLYRGADLIDEWAAGHGEQPDPEGWVW